MATTVPHVLPPGGVTKALPRLFSQAATQVSISATWRTSEDPPGLADINLTVTVSRLAETVGAALGAALEKNLAARPLAEPVVHISLEGVNR